MARRRREPSIEVREHRCADGSVTEMWSVRHYDVANFGAPFVGYSTGEVAIGNGLNNDTTSIRWS